MFVADVEDRHFYATENTDRFTELDVLKWNIFICGNHLFITMKLSFFICCTMFSNILAFVYMQLHETVFGVIHAKILPFLRNVLYKNNLQVSDGCWHLNSNMFAINAGMESAHEHKQDRGFQNLNFFHYITEFVLILVIYRSFGEKMKHKIGIR